MDVGNSPSRLELKLSQEDKSRVSQLAVDSAVISAPDNQPMLRVTLEPGIAEEIFDSIQALVAGTEVDVTKLALRGSSEFIPTKNPVIKQAMAQATGELTGEKAALVEQLGKYQDLSKAIRTSPKKPFAAQVEKYSGFLEGKIGSTKRQLNSLLDRVDTMVQRGMLTESQANKITRRTPGEPKRSATESGQQRYMPAGDMATGRSVKDHREAMDLFEKGYRIYGAPYDGMEDPIRLKKASEIENYDPENLWAVPSKKIAAAIGIRNMPADLMPSPDSAMPGAYSFPGGYRALPGKAKGSLRIYGPAGSLIGIASSLDEAQRILRRKGNR